MRLLTFIMLLLIPALLVGCGNPAQPTDRDAGPRIVSLSPAASVMLRDAGLEGRIVGRHGWDAVLDSALPVAGDQTGLDYERLIGLDPTHIVIEWGARELPERLRSLADERGYGVISIETLTLRDISASAAKLTQALPDSGEALPDAADRLLRERGAKPDWGSVLLVVATSPTVDCLGPGSAHHELLESGGFTPAPSGEAPWVSISVEDAIRMDPSCIVLVQPSDSPDAGGGTVAERLGPLAGTEIEAVRLGRVVVIDDPLALIPSTNLAAFADELWAGLDALGPLPSPRDE